MGLRKNLKFDLDSVPEEISKIKNFFDKLSADQRQFVIDAWKAYKTGQYKGSIINLARHIKERAKIPVGASYLGDWMSDNDEILSEKSK